MSLRLNNLISSCCFTFGEDKMNVAIVGYGKMGAEIEKIAKARGINIVSIIDKSSPNAQYKGISEESVGQADVCIDFTHPESVIENVKKVSSLKKSMVLGTTGW